jgi:hypothetical protein
MYFCVIKRNSHMYGIDKYMGMHAGNSAHVRTQFSHAAELLNAKIQPLLLLDIKKA